MKYHTFGEVKTPNPTEKGIMGSVTKQFLTQYFTLNECKYFFPNFCGTVIWLKIWHGQAVTRFVLIKTVPCFYMQLWAHISIINHVLCVLVTLWVLPMVCIDVLGNIDLVKIHWTHYSANWASFEHFGMNLTKRYIGGGPLTALSNPPPTPPHHNGKITWYMCIIYR